MRNEDILKGIINISKKAGFTSANTLYSHSLCPDEINHEDQDISDLLQKYFGEYFALGGLAGIPFTGTTGFGAFAAHVTDGGNIFVLFAPHVAISTLGECGCYNRIGQEKESSACGAIIGAWKAVKDLQTPPMPDPDTFDLQMDYIKALIWEKRDRIKAAENAIAEATNVVYEKIQELMEILVETKYSENHKIIVLGGIQINAEYCDDYFEPR